MKNILILSLAVASITACKKKDSGPAPFTWPDGTGEYAPYTIGSKFTYETSTGSVIDSFTHTVEKDTLIDGSKFYKLTSDKPSLAGNVYVRYAGGVRTDVTLNFNFNGVNVPQTKLDVLKDGAPLNTPWTNTLNIVIPAQPPTIPFNIPLTITFTHNNIQKDFTKNILAVNYANTIHCRQVATLPAGTPLPPNIPSSVTVNNYFSKGVGLSEREATATTWRIKRAVVKK